MGCLLWVLLVVTVIYGSSSRCGWGRQLGEAGRGGGRGEAAVKAFGEVKEGKVVLVTLKRGPMQVDLMNWGARIQALHLPDAHGTIADLVLGFDSFKDYQNVSADPYFGAIVGRVANRIAGGTFVLDNVRYNISKNEGNNTLHGGVIGFDKVLWDASAMVDELDGTPCAQFKYHSFDGEQGFPGDVNVTVTYKLTNEMELVVDMTGKVGSKSTPVNMAQHTYWNLGGHNSGTILNNTIEIAGERVTVVDKELIPTGEMEDVKGTPYDFLRARVIGSEIEKLSGGYDINYELNRMKKGGGEGEWLHFAAKVTEPRSRRSLEVFTNQPGLQFYTSNSLSGVKGKGGAFYNNHAALCLETQGFPNAVNQPSFPSIIVRPGRTYHHHMLYRFSIVT